MPGLALPKAQTLKPEDIAGEAGSAEDVRFAGVSLSSVERHWSESKNRDNAL